MKENLSASRNIHGVFGLFADQQFWIQIQNDQKMQSHRLSEKTKNAFTCIALGFFPQCNASWVNA